MAKLYQHIWNMSHLIQIRHTRNSFELTMCIYEVIAKTEKVHGKKIKLKNSFVKAPKNLARYISKNIILSHHQNYMRSRELLECQNFLQHCLL